MRFGALLALVIAGWFFASSAGAALYPQNPLRAGDSIYVSHEGVYRFDRDRAEPLWHSLAGVHTYAPVLHRGLLLVGSTQGLYALNADDGRIAWHIEKQHNLFTPSLAELAYSGSVHGELYAIGLRDGRIAWRRQFDGWVYSPAIDAERELLWTGGQAHVIYALDADDGSQLHEIPTLQESVFGGVALGDDRIAFNLFDGSSVLIDSGSGQIEKILTGESQPTAILRRGDKIYRTHSDGSLSVFEFGPMTPAARLELLPQNLEPHPSLPGFLLLGNRDRELVLLKLAQNGFRCRFVPGGRWLLPIQVEADSILVFRKLMQPPRLRAVQLPVKCQ